MDYLVWILPYTRWLGPAHRISLTKHPNIINQLICYTNILSMISYDFNVDSVWIKRKLVTTGFHCLSLQFLVHFIPLFLWDHHLHAYLQSHTNCALCTYIIHFSCYHIHILYIFLVIVWNLSTILHTCIYFMVDQWKQFRAFQSANN